MKLDLDKIFKDGGGTFNINTNEIVLFSEGYLVGGQSLLTVPTFNFDKRDLTKIVQAIIRLFNIDSPLLGFWFNEGVLYIDSVVYIKDFNDALSLAKANNQKAIWDCFNECSIFIDK